MNRRFVSNRLVWGSGLLAGLLAALLIQALWLPTSAPLDRSALGHFAGKTSARLPLSPRPLLIKHGWDVPSPKFVHNHVKAMEAMPFDGLVIGLPGLSHRVQRKSPISHSRFESVLAPVAATRFTSLNHNFALVYATSPGSYFAEYSVPVRNFARLARAARAAGFVGIAYDNEEYFGSVSDYPEVCPGRTLAQCRTQARLRGRQIMDAMRTAWPSIRVLTLIGPWISEALTARYLSPTMPYNDISGSNELMGSFFVGMAQSTVGTRAKVIDGGEIYTARTRAQFSAVRWWQERGMPSTSGIIPKQLKPHWADSVSAGFGVYDRPINGADMDVAIWRRTLANALRATDRYVWAYTERFDWWGGGWPPTRVPRLWVNATADAQSRVRGRARSKLNVLNGLGQSQGTQ